MNSPCPATREVGAADPHPVTRHHSAVRRTAVAALITATLLLYLIAAGPTMISAAGQLAGASPTWLLAGLTATVCSMIAFAGLRTLTLAVGGAHFHLRQALAVSYGAGAVHITLPAGAVFSTTYAFRHLRSRGISAAAATWSMSITGLLSTLTLSAVGLTGLALNAGTGGSPIPPVLEILLTLSAIYGALRVSRHPHAVIGVALRVLVPVNRFRGRPAETGVRRLPDTVADMQLIQPTLRGWSVATALALANWALDLACLAACCAAVNVHISAPALLLTYITAMAAGSLLALPGGLGAVETAMTVGLTMAGAIASPALAATVLYRLLSTGSVVIIGWSMILAQRIHRSRLPKSPLPSECSPAETTCQHALHPRSCCANGLSGGTGRPRFAR